MAQTRVTLDDAREHHLAGRYDEALAAYGEVAANLEATDPSGAAAAHNNSCLILMDRGDYRMALERCESAVRLRRETKDEKRLARGLNNLGLALEQLGRFAEARVAFLEALRVNEEIGEAEAQVINLGNLGSLARKMGHYGNALERHGEAVALTDQNATEPWATSRRQIAMINQGAVLGQVGADREALELYQEVLRQADELDSGQQAALRGNIGVAYRNLGDSVAAKAAFLEAARYYEDEGNLAGLSNALLNLGLTEHLNLENLEAAERSFVRALELARESGDRPEEIQDLFYLGTLYLDAGRIDEAVEQFEACLEMSRESDSAEGLWSALDGLGRAAEAGGDLNSALDYLNLAISEIEQVRSDLVPGSRRAGFFGDKRPIYGAAVRVLSRLAENDETGRYAEEALVVVQAAKARELVEALGAGSASTTSVEPAALRENLGLDVILEYFIADDRLYLWVIRQTKIRFFDLGSSGPILETVGRVHADLARGHDPEKADLRSLSASLLAPVGPLAADSNLTIAPDLRLHYLPFELLPYPEDPARSLLDRATVNYLPSASAGEWLRERPVASTRRVVCFGNPLFGDGLGPTAEAWPARLGLEPLRASQDELDAIARWLPGDRVFRVGGEATEEAFKRAVADGAKVVHLATHSVVDETRRRQGAAIVLTPSEGDDGLLYPQEIAALDYGATLTVIAACRTALGSVEDGRALASLTGAFLAAGSSAVLATLWDVADNETAVFMEQFYYFLGRGLVPAEALRQTKQRLRADPRWRRSSLWAGYVLIGRAPKLATGDRVPLWAILAAAALIAALWILARQRTGTPRA